MREPSATRSAPYRRPVKSHLKQKTDQQTGKIAPGVPKNLTRGPHFFLHWLTRRAKSPANGLKNPVDHRPCILSPSRISPVTQYRHPKRCGRPGPPVIAHRQAGRRKAFLPNPLTSFPATTHHAPRTPSPDFPGAPHHRSRKASPDVPQSLTR